MHQIQDNLLFVLFCIILYTCNNKRKNKVDIEFHEIVHICKIDSDKYLMVVETIIWKRVFVKKVEIEFMNK